MIQKFPLGTNDDGTLRYFFVSDKDVVVPGPITGVVTLASGVDVNVSAEVVEVDSPEQALEVAHLVAIRLHKEGHPTDASFQYPFVDLGRVPTQADVHELLARQAESSAESLLSQAQEFRAAAAQSSADNPTTEV